MNTQQRILIVEDEQSIADNIRISLKSEGFICQHVTLAQQAIEAVRHGRINLVVLDIGLPDGSGFDACKAIRAVSQVPVIFLTARSEEIDRVVGLEIGADDYMTKPFSPRELVARIKLRLRDSERSQSFTSELSRHESFALDEEKKSITYQNQPLALTAFEFGILKAMLAQPGRVFSRNQLIAAVRDMPEVVLARAVDTHIKTLRAKLKGIDNLSSPIKTHRGLGYSIQP